MQIEENHQKWLSNYRYRWGKYRIAPIFIAIWHLGEKGITKSSRTLFCHAQDMFFIHLYKYQTFLSRSNIGNIQLIRDLNLVHRETLYTTPVWLGKPLSSKIAYAFPVHVLHCILCILSPHDNSINKHYAYSCTHYLIKLFCTTWSCLHAIHLYFRSCK